MTDDIKTPRVIEPEQLAAVLRAMLDKYTDMTAEAPSHEHCVELERSLCADWEVSGMPSARDIDHLMGDVEETLGNGDVLVDADVIRRYPTVDATMLAMFGEEVA